MYKGHTWLNTVGSNVCLLLKTGIWFTENDSYSAGSVNQHKMSVGKWKWMSGCSLVLICSAVIE